MNVMGPAFDGGLCRPGKGGGELFAGYGSPPLTGVFGGTGGGE